MTARLRTRRINTPATAAPGADTSRDPCASRLLVPGAAPCGERSRPDPTRRDPTGRPDPATPGIRRHPAGSLTPPDPPPLKVPCALGRPSWRCPLSPRSLCRTPSSRWALPGPRRLCRLSLVSCPGTGCRGRRKPLGPRHPRSPAPLPPGARTSAPGARRPHRPFPCRCPEAAPSCSPPCSSPGPFQPPQGSGHR